jgi:hypothetical protein
LSRVTDDLVRLKPSLSCWSPRMSPPLATPCWLACMCPKEPAPCTTMVSQRGSTRVVAATWLHDARRASTCRLSSCALWVMAAPPNLMMRRSCGWGAPLSCWAIAARAPLRAAGGELRAATTM